MLPRRPVTAAVVLAWLTVLGGCQGLLTATPAGQETQFVTPEAAAESDGTPDLRFPDLSGATFDEGPAVNDSEAAALVANWTLEQKVGALFLIHVEGTTIGNHQSALDDLGVSGFLILGNNVSRDQERSREFLSSLRELSSPDLLVAIDQEGGAVQRLRPDPLPAAPELGLADVSETREATANRNQLVFDAGGNVNFGLVADVSPGEDAYIDNRSFGEDTETVTQHVLAALAGEVPGVAVAVKHFPGHGLTTEDTHRVIARSSLSLTNWLNTHAPPFQAAVDNDVPMLMLGHLVVDNVEPIPASLSKKWVRILREEWGYQGVLVTDDLSMLEGTKDNRYSDFALNAKTAVAAGADLVVDAGGASLSQAKTRVSQAVEQIVQAVESGEIPLEQIDRSVARVVELRLSLGGVSRPLEDTDAG